MDIGSIQVAEHQGVYVIKMEGDVRLTLCLSFDQFIQAMLDSDGFCSVIFDLSKATAIDSTTLGLMAKISILSKNLSSDLPMVITASQNIRRLLVSMGFEDIVSIVEQASIPELIPQDIVVAQLDEDLVRQKVLEAHRYLITLSEHNASAFRELVDTLESDNNTSNTSQNNKGAQF